MTTDWKRSNKVVAVEPLKFRLQQFGIKNLTIVSDACLNFVNSQQLENITEDGVLAAGFTAERRLELDRFNAAQDGKSAYMARASKPENARCILSGVLVDALWGHEADAFDKYVPDKITSGSLCEFLPARTQSVGETYSVDSRAEVFPGLPREHVIYRDKATSPSRAPNKGWPVIAAKQDAEIPSIKNTSNITPADKSMHRRGATFGYHQGNPNDEQFAKILYENSTLKVPDSNAGLNSRTQMIESDLRRPFRLAHHRWPLPDVASLTIAARSFDKRVWLPDGLVPSGNDSVQNYSIGHGADWAQILVQYLDETFVPVVLCKGLRTTVSFNGKGFVGWMFDVPGAHNGGDASIVAKMATGSISPSDVDTIAADIRKWKHQDPMLGAIAAYLYDYSGDLDNIRRMGWYYKKHAQPIPYDVALMGMMSTWTENKGEIFASIPPTLKRKAPNLPNYATAATREVKRWPVAGLCPWLRQGWDFVENPATSEKAMVTGLEDIRQHLLPSSFSVLNEEGGHKLIDRWGLKEQS